MDILIEKEAAIFVALLYRHIVGKESLTEQQFEEYLEEVLGCLYAHDQVVTFESVNEEEAREYYGISYDAEQQLYSLIEKENTIAIYDALPRELVLASLSMEALWKIGVMRKDLAIEKQYIRTSGIKAIATLHALRAQEETKNILFYQGCQNIQIGRTVPFAAEDEKAYDVFYSCERPYEKVNVKKSR